MDNILQADQIAQEDQDKFIRDSELKLDFIEFLEAERFYDFKLKEYKGNSSQEVDVNQTNYRKTRNALAKLANVDYRLIDQIVFDDEIVCVCNDLANRGIRVIVAGLDMDFKGNPFGPMPHLMATAEYVTKVHAICTRTGQLANHSFRKGENDSLVMLGETAEYEPLSRAAFHKLMVREKVRKMNVTSETVTPKKSKNA